VDVPVGPGKIVKVRKNKKRTQLREEPKRVDMTFKRHFQVKTIVKKYRDSSAR
jgi:hypothetical protein